MPTLHISQSTESSGRYRVDVRLEGDGFVPCAAKANFDFEMTAQDREDLRWYLEDFLKDPHDPAPTIAARVEKKIAEIGTKLFKELFHSSDDARDLWATLRTQLNDTRVEIVTSVEEAASIPWELLRDPKTDTPLPLRARSFVRALPRAAQRPKLPPMPQADAGPIRILLVICRPGGDDDVPFRSVAARLIKGLGDDARAAFQLDVLRPPTFDQLGRVLRDAKADGRPYHVVHFDGHGMYADVADSARAAESLRSLMPLMLSGPRAGSHGYLLFENPGVKQNLQLVSGPALGKLLVETDVPTLVLNACRSAHAEPPDSADDADSPDNRPQTQPDDDDPHAQIRALGSLAQEVMDAGVTGVVAMRYNVYVVTAAQFVADLYAELTRGRSLGEAVTLGRKQLDANPLREIAYEPRALQDWFVPVVYEAAPITLFPVKKGDAPLTVTLDADRDATQRGSLDENLPKRPDVGFFGRDETLLALDRAFDTHRVVLLHAYAGAGKSAAAAEFARWYALTGGVDGPVLFTSFEQQQPPLARVLDRVGQVFGPTLEQSGVKWLTLDDADRRGVALQVFKQIPVLWIWDNVEPIAGFPAGSESRWTVEQQKELVDFLRDASETKAKFLLTSRRDEREWLGKELPKRIQMPPMPMQERVQLARALAAKHDRRVIDVKAWQPLLRFTAGNPLTITVLVGQALRDGLKTFDQIQGFVDRLRAGEADFEDEADEGRSKSLGASLSYGFEHAFNEDDRKQLALLHFFQGFVDVDALKRMGDPEEEWCLPELRGLSREAGIALLNRAAEIGLLTAHGGGYYTIHPALPWFFKDLFDTHYPASSDPQAQSANPQLAATRAFAEAMSALGDHYINQYGTGNRDVISALKAEEGNLLHARRLARAHGWWSPVISTMQGLRALYDHTGRRADWARLVHEIVPDFVDPATDGPLPERQEVWGIVTAYRVGLAKQALKWAKAERLQRVRVDWDRKRAASVLELSPDALNDVQRNDIRTLVVSLHDLGEIQRERQEPSCVRAYEEAFDLTKRINDRPSSAVCVFNLGHALKDIATIRDLAKAEDWYRRSFELRDERDRQGRGQCLGQLGSVALERFNEAVAAKEPEKELLRHLNAALDAYRKVLNVIPPDAVDDLAVAHNQLGMVYERAGDLDRALPHFRKSIQYQEMQGNLYNAAGVRFNVAVTLTGAGRFEDAMDYARSALRGFSDCGPGATDQVRKCQDLIRRIQELSSKADGS